MKLIYIAGPYRPTKIDGVENSTEQNVQRARHIAVHLVNVLGRLGYFPVTPHLNTDKFELLVDMNDDRYFLDGTMAMLDRCDAVLLVYPEAARDSSGTRAEVERAIDIGLPIYGSLQQLHDDATAKASMRAATGPYTLTVDVARASKRLQADVLLDTFRAKHPDIARAASQMLCPGPITMAEIEQAFSTCPPFPVTALDLRPGDTNKRGDVVNSTEQMDGGDVKVNWRDGASEIYGNAEVFQIVARKAGPEAPVPFDEAWERGVPTDAERRAVATLDYGALEDRIVAHMYASAEKVPTSSMVPGDIRVWRYAGVKMVRDAYTKDGVTTVNWVGGGRIRAPAGQLQRVFRGFKPVDGK